MSELPERIWADDESYWQENPLPPASFVLSSAYVRADLYDTVTAERDTAKEIIKEMLKEVLAEFDDLDDALGLSVKERDLLARAKELLK